MVKIDIISGFLGAGKTTLIKKLLKDGFQGEQVVLIENEFGEIGIDGGFLKEAGIQIREMNSGCICCSLVGDFGTSLKEVVTKYDPDRILIEPSGVGKLSDVIKAVQGVQDEVDIKLNSYTTVVDAKKCKMYMKNFGEFFDNQIQYAGAIIMSRTDIASEKKVQESLELLRSLNKDAAIITTPIENLDGKKLVEVMEHPVSLEQEMLEEEHEHHHHHDGECGCGMIMKSMSITITTTESAAVAMIMKSMSITITMTESAAAAMIMKSMSITITTTESVAVDMTTTIIMQMRSSQAGAVRLLKNIHVRDLRRSLRHFPSLINTVSSSVLKGMLPDRRWNMDLF